MDPIATVAGPERRGQGGIADADGCEAPARGGERHQQMARPESARSLVQPDRIESAERYA